MHAGLTTAAFIWYYVTTAVAPSSTRIGGFLIQTAPPVNGSNSTASEYNAIVGNTTACDSPPQPVSAASALWALIALAINAMTQRSRADHLDVLSPARSSPFVCLADVVVVLLWLAHGTRRGLGVKGSMYWYRKEMRLLRGNSDRQLIEGIPAVTIFFFILGPLPQAIKAIGAGGLYWTKAWAALFVSAWCVEVVVRFSSGLCEPTDVETAAAGLGSRACFLRKISLMVHQVAFVTQYCVWLWVVIMLSQSEMFRKILAVPVAGSLIVLYLIFLFIGGLPPMLRDFEICRRGICWYPFFIIFEGLYIAMLIWSIQRVKTWIAIASEALAFVPGSVLFSGAIYVFSLICTALLIHFDDKLVELGRQSRGDPADAPPSPEEARTRPNNGGPPSNLTLSRSSTEDFAHPIANRLWRFVERFSKLLAKRASFLSMPWGDIGDDQIRRVLSITFALANLPFATLYYCILYDSTGTVKPSWTELLG